MKMAEIHLPEKKKVKVVPKTNIRKVGFCGADDSVSPLMLGMVCQSYPWVEFGILFRPDKEGEPRYASKDWVSTLGSVAATSGGRMTLAAHLCGKRVNEILNGNDEFISTLYPLGFRRVQINATAINGVDTSNLSGSTEMVAKVFSQHQELEFMLQKNEETSPLWEGILQSDSDICGSKGELPSNVTMLLDESKGTGTLSKTYPLASDFSYDIGYAGGISPNNINIVLQNILDAGNGRSVWIDMESSLRSEKNGKDIFDLDKCYQCIESVCDAGIYEHPSFLHNSSK